SGLLGLIYQEQSAVFNTAGILGFYLVGFFKKYLGNYGTFFTFLLLLIVNGLLLFSFFFIDIWNFFKSSFVKIKEAMQRVRQVRAEVRRQQPQKRAGLKEVRVEEKRKERKPEIKLYVPKVETASVPKPPPLAPASNESVESRVEVEKKIKALEEESARSFDASTYRLPSVSLLKVPPAVNIIETKESIEENIKNLEDTLSDFGVEAKVVSVQKGPVVTMYELQPQAGVKIQRISVLSDDIALAMKSSSVRIVAPLPGRGTVGVEVPNEKKQFVFLREVLEERAFVNSRSKLTLVIGKDVSGNPVVADLKEMPHLLIAGATGSGKTVCVNSLISSILYKSKPDEVKLILIDPKMVELAPYAAIPHLLHPVICEAKKAFIALNWAVEEMERRYRALASEGARNIESYNARGGEKLPYIIIIVDELADLMVVAKESVETAIQRLAQLSRAVGIHLVLATQRPSVDVITGIIKANFPARISFKVSSKVDSRTVLDGNGADKLLGKGDLLFLKPGAVKLIRAQGAFIDDEDIETLTNFVRSQGGPVYEEAIIEGEKKHALNVEGDELYDDAVRTILQARQASASILQRRLRVGYTRAARLLDLMEQTGVVGPFCGSKAREILVDPEEFLNEKGLV
ncbi:MAG: DNA translocase FtsK, partial [Candidatus Omnitrophota bacterium]